MPRKLDAGLAGRYGMSSVLMTSTMKSDPAGAVTCGPAGGTPVSATATWADGGSADGRGGVASAAGRDDTVAGAGDTAPAPATATPARNFRRFTFARVSSRAMWL